jgi:hypothetical protein
MKMATPRQIQDFRNGYSLGYREARHGETSVEGNSPSTEHAEGVAAGLRDGRTGGPGRSSVSDIENATIARFTAAEYLGWQKEMEHGTTKH